MTEKQTELKPEQEKKASEVAIDLPSKPSAPKKDKMSISRFIKKKKKENLGLPEPFINAFEFFVGTKKLSHFETEKSFEEIWKEYTKK